MPCPARDVPPPSNRDKGLEGTKGTRGNPRESRGRLRRAEEHPASPHDVADPAAQQGPSVHCDPPSATKRPFGRDVRRPGITADFGKLVRLRTVAERPLGGGSGRP